MNNKSANRLVVSFMGLVCILLSAGISLGMGSAPKAPRIDIRGQEAKLSPAMLGVSSVFMTIENSGNGDDNLLSARASFPGAVVELHDVKDGRMVKTDKIRVPAGSTVELKPKSLHIMMFKLPKDLKEGSELTLSLTFEISGEKQVPVKFSKASHGAHQHSH